MAKLVRSLPALSMPETVDVRGMQRRLHVRAHARAKRLILRFDPRTGDGRLTIPPGTPASAVLTFLSQSRTWIDENAPDHGVDQNQPYRSTIPLSGVPHRLVPTGKVRGTVRCQPDGTLHVPGTPDRVMPRLRQFLKAKAEREITPLVLRLSDRLGRTPKAIRFRDPKTQWGSCNSQRVITLSWRVIMAAPAAQHYLAAHEVAHLREMNHSASFWRTVEDIDPAWKDGQALLKAVEKDLLAINFD